MNCKFYIATVLNLAIIILVISTVKMLWAGCPRNHNLTADRGKKFFSFPKCSDCLWSPSSLLFNGNKVFFTERQSGQGVKLTNHLHLVPRLRMTGDIPELPHMPSWQSQGQLYLYL